LQYLPHSSPEKGLTTTLYAHQSLGTNRRIVPTNTTAPPPLEINDSSSLFTRDSSTLEHQEGVTKLYIHQSLGNNNNMVPNPIEGVLKNDAESTSSSLPHIHYPIVSEHQDTLLWNSSVSKLVEGSTIIDRAKPISSSSTTTSFEDISSAVPINSTTNPSNEKDTYSRQVSESSFVSNNSLGVNSLKSKNSLLSNKGGSRSTAQSVLDLSTNSLADALISQEDEGGGYNYYYRDYENENEKDIDQLSDSGGYSADQSSFTLQARPIDECSESGSSSNAPSFAMMELKQALPMGESEDEDHSHVHQYGFGHLRGMEMYNSSRHRGEGMRTMAKPVIPQTFPSLLDSSMSSSYSMVSAPPSATPSFDNVDVVSRESSAEEREDTLLPPHHQIMGVSHAPQVGYNIGEPLAIEVPLPIPVTTDGSRYIVDLEQIAEESSGQDVGELSASSPGSGDIAKSAEDTFAKNANEREAQDHQIASMCQIIDENHPTPASKPDQQIHRNPNDQFFNYRHQYYTEQYHYFDEDKKYPSKGGDDDTDSTCSSVTLSQAFQRVHSDDDSYASSSFMTESSSHPTLSTVSSVTLSRALSVDRHDHSDQGFYVAVRLGDYVEGQNNEQIEVESVREEEISCVDVEERDSNEAEQKSKADSKTDHDSNQSMENTSNDPGAGEDVLSDAPAEATKAITQSDERVESDILNMLIPECGVPIPSVMSKMGKQKSKGGMLLPWHSTRSIQNYQYGGGRRKKRSNMSSTSSLFSISSVHTFRG
jgi:hypothetical protein